MKAGIFQTQSKEEFINQLKLFYKEKNVFLSIKNSNNRQVILKCDRGGLAVERDPRVPRKRNTSSRLFNCPFSIYCSLKNNIWTSNSPKHEHNHPIVTDLREHSLARRPNEEQKVRILELAKASVPVKHILTTLKVEFNNDLTTARDVINLIAAQKRKMLDSLTTLEKLAATLRIESKYHSSLKLDNENRFYTTGQKI
ncbi:hypothetical protein BC833DRAFT_625766 [Globomyces pollinis-pini]|nr:hypothetical protein BC833DRAFT_625766 [Globomyces pollinis-pini]